MSWTTYRENSLPFIANQHSIVRGTGRQIDWTRVPDSFGADAYTITLTAGVALDATTMSVEALPVAIPAGTVLYFGELDELVRVSAPAAAGATSVTIDAAVSALESGDTATYRPFGASGRGKVIPAGTIMAELASGKIIPRSAVTGAETATHILESAVVEDVLYEQLGHGVIVGGVIYENLLPDFADANFATWQGELEVAGVGIGFRWETYADNTA